MQRAPLGFLFARQKLREEGATAQERGEREHRKHDVHRMYAAAAYECRHERARASLTSRAYNAKCASRKCVDDAGQVVISSVLLPLGVGLAIGRWQPAARRWIPAIQKVSTVLLLVCAVVIIVGAWSLMASVVRQWTTTAIILISLIWLAIGHFLGGPDEDDRTVLAFACVARHPGVAIAVASFTDQPLAPVGVLTAVLVSELAMTPYKAWRKRHRAAATGAAGQGPHLTGAHEGRRRRLETRD